jgi:glycosyltransferase involved in cell wall biosynthesis
MPTDMPTSYRATESGCGPDCDTMPQSRMSNDQPQSDAGASPLRVLHGLTGAAGQPWTTTRALRELGMQADCVRVGPAPYGYRADRVVPRADDASLRALLSDVIDAYDVFHFYFRSFFFTPTTLRFPTALDLLALRAVGKTVIMNFRGSEARLHSQFRRNSPFHYVDENPDRLIELFPEEAQQRYINLCTAVADRILVPDAELQGYVPHAVIVPRAINLADWPCPESTTTDRPLVVHAPSRRIVKGSDHVEAAVRALRAEGVSFEFRLIEKMRHEDAKATYRAADIIIDQLRIGWYGVLAVEGMAMGKAVISYVRDDLRHHLPDPPPLAYADPTTITDVLRDLITDRPKRTALANRGYDFCARTHDARLVAAQLANIYRDARTNPAPVDVAAVSDFIAWQKRQIDRAWPMRMARWASYPWAFGRSLFTRGPADSFRRMREVLGSPAARNGGDLR